MPLVPAGARVLVEFKAGRLIRDGTLVKPDTRKGLLRVIRVRELKSAVHHPAHSNSAITPGCILCFDRL